MSVGGAITRRFYDPETESKTWVEKIFFPEHDDYSIGHFASIANIEMEGESEENTLRSSMPHIAVKIEDKNNAGNYGVGFLLPLEIAPEVLAVNSDFDEGRIDPTTGYAIPDCDDIAGVDRKTGSGNTLMTLEVERDHLDDLSIKDNELVVDDLHRGWFGVRPSDSEMWDGATVTIKKIDKTDEDRGYKESGQVRFYAKWGDTGSEFYGIEPYGIEPYGIEPYGLDSLTEKNLVQTGVNGGGAVYGSTSTIPNDAKFYMEEVCPGKITLEWRYKKGNVDIKHEQTFLVSTEKSKEKWQEQVRYEIRLETNDSVNMDDYTIDAHPLISPTKAKNFADNRDYIHEVYDYYAELYCHDQETYYWAGMAKLAGAPVYAGLSDAQYGRTLQYIFSVPGGLASVVLRDIQDILVEANKNIFLDLAWQFAAYHASGIEALEYVRDIDERLLEFSAWENINEGKLNGNLQQVLDGNEALLRREQSVILRETYIDLESKLFGFVDKGFSMMAENPILGGGSFQTIVPGGSLSNFNDRWTWITKPNAGMLGIWTSTAKATRKTWVEESLHSRCCRIHQKPVTCILTMKPTSLFITVLFSLSLGLCEPGPPQFEKPSVTLDFSQGHSMDIIKNSGLILNDISNSSTESYSFQKEKILIKLPNNREIKQNVTLGIVDAKNGNLVRFSSTGVIMPDEEAYEVAKVLHQNLNLPLNTLEKWYKTEMQNYVRNRKAFSISANMNSYSRISFGLNRSMNKLYPWVVNMTITWDWRKHKGWDESRANTEMKFPSEKYATISLEPPSGNVYDRRDDIKKSLEEWRKHNPKEAKEFDERQAKAKGNQVREPKSISKKASSEADKTASFPWWLIGIIALIAILGFFLVKSKWK